MEAVYTLKEIPLEERPRERFFAYGSEALASSELIAIVLGSGMQGKSVLQLSQELLSHFGSLVKLAEATVEELCQIKGIGKAKAIQLQAAFTLGIKAARQTTKARHRVESPITAYHYLKDFLENEEREHFVALLLDSKGFVIRHEIISVGTLTETLVHPREVFYPAVRHKASSIILAHNHPSGDPTPSKNDLEITKQLMEAANVMEIEVQDHIIVGRGRYTSLRQHGAMK